MRTWNLDWLRRCVKIAFNEGGEAEVEIVNRVVRFREALQEKLREKKTCSFLLPPSLGSNTKWHLGPWMHFRSSFLVDTYWKPVICWALCWGLIMYYLIESTVLWDLFDNSPILQRVKLRVRDLNEFVQGQSSRQSWSWDSNPGRWTPKLCPYPLWMAETWREFGSNLALLSLLGKPHASPFRAPTCICNAAPLTICVGMKS